jgi:hypothetical protein
MSKVTIKGVFLKKEVVKDKMQYHFILPEIYHNTPDKPSHTFVTLTNFHNNITKDLEKKVDNATISNIAEIHNYSPIYRDSALISRPFSDHAFTNFRAKLSKTSDNFIVGLEYQLTAYLTKYSFVDNSNQINGWYIRIVSFKEAEWTY